ncbi:hypothetical protein GpartN1_g1770.t1 [Galdieria partita]|uniref:Uncharacterized protein n=1 Tax=Galdieria partita TaxID=83374 RepID=A0A9C7PTF3_9RHOD|nr:hypothetical protein GpartN1_g1770.t1 [Galdieria partita]
MFFRSRPLNFLLLLVGTFTFCLKYFEEIAREQVFKKTKPSIAIIIPLRDRPTEEKFIRLYFSRYLSQFQDISYEIFFAEQLDDNLFNRGLLFNAAFLSLENRSFDCFCLQDADTIPMTNNLLYRCPKSSVPYHLTPANLHPHVHYEDSGAGNIIFTPKQFKIINGFGSMFWGWGKEDDNIVRRFKACNMWPFEVPLETSERFMHIDCSTQRMENQAPDNMKRFLLEDLGKYGLNTSNFEMISFQILDSEPIPISKISFRLDCNKNLTPWCKQ